jgi:hypothetical protein
MSADSRMVRIAPTEYCSRTKTGFISDFFEDQYTFRSTATSAYDGRLVDANIKTIGSGHGCIGRTADPSILNFYLELQLGHTALKGIGECHLAKSDFPERGLIALSCFLNLSDPIGRYVGGQLTANSITSLRAVGLETDPPGYTQPSIATIRLWANLTLQDWGRVARHPELIGKRMRWHSSACRCYKVRPFPQNGCSGPAGARALGTDCRRRFNPSYRALREFLSEGKSSGFPWYLSRMSPGFRVWDAVDLAILNLSTLLPKSFNRTSRYGLHLV